MKDKPASISQLITQKRLKTKPIRFIDMCGEQYVFSSKSEKQSVLDNLDKLPFEAFKIFKNLNGECAIKQIEKLPFFHLI